MEILAFLVTIIANLVSIHPNVLSAKLKTLSLPFQQAVNAKQVSLQ
jgi:hypothetical protein